MGFLSAYDDVETIDLGGGWWVKIKQFPTDDEQATIEKRLMSTRMDMAGDKPRMDAQIDTAAYAREQLVVYVVDWNLTDSSDLPLPLHPESAKRAAIGQLPRVVTAKIRARINELEKRDPAEAAGFPVAGSDGDPERTGGAAAAGAISDRGSFLDEVWNETGRLGVVAAEEDRGLHRDHAD